MRRPRRRLPALARIINQELGDLAERTAFLAVVDNDAQPADLAGARAFLDAVDQIRTASADVRAEYVRSVALVMHTTGDLGAVIGKFVDITNR